MYVYMSESMSFYVYVQVKNVFGKKTIIQQLDVGLDELGSCRCYVGFYVGL